MACKPAKEETTDCLFSITYECGTRPLGSGRRRSPAYVHRDLVTAAFVFFDRHEQCTLPYSAAAELSPPIEQVIPTFKNR